MFHLWSEGNTHVLTGKFDLTNVNNMAFYISGPKLLFETTEISTHPNSTQQESNYIYLYTTKFGTSIKIRLNRKFESTEFETMRVNCISDWRKIFNELNDINLLNRPIWQMSINYPKGLTSVRVRNLQLCKWVKFMALVKKKYKKKSKERLFRAIVPQLYNVG